MSPELRFGDPEEVGMSSTRIRRIARLAEKWVDDGDASALVVLAARRGIIVLLEAFGRLGPEPDTLPVPPNAIFSIASISKSITAVAALMLVEDGLLSLNRPVGEYLPAFQGSGKDALMVHHLLTHTAGIDDDRVKEYVLERKLAGELTEPDVPSDPFSEVAPSLRYRAAVHAAPLARPPGLEMTYSNQGYTILGEVIEAVARQSLDGLVDERIFRPLGMRDSYYPYPVNANDRLVSRWDKTGIVQLPRLDFPRSAFAVAGVCSTAFDMAIFGQMLLNDGRYGDVRILGPVAVAALTTNQIPGIPAHYGGQFFPEATWGLGVDVQGNKKALRFPSLRSSDAYGHQGSGGTLWWVDPAYDLVAIYFSYTPNLYPDHVERMEKWNADLFVNAVTAALDTV